MGGIRTPVGTAVGRSFSARRRSREPMAVALLAAEQHAGRLAITPRAVTTTSETLTRELRQRIRGGFGAPVADNFGSSEGLLGLSQPDQEPIEFASDLAIAELVDDDGRPVLTAPRPPGYW